MQRLFAELTDRIPAKMMMDPRSICHTEASTYRSPIPCTQIIEEVTKQFITIVKAACNKTKFYGAVGVLSPDFGRYSRLSVSDFLKEKQSLSFYAVQE